MTGKTVNFCQIDEKTQVEQIRQFYNEKGANLDAKGSDDLFENTAEIIDSSKFLGKLPSEKDVELVLNALFSLIIMHQEEQAYTLVQKLYDLFNTDAFTGHGWQSHAGVAVRIFSNLFYSYSDRPKLQLLTFKSLLKLCGRARLTTFLDTDLKQIDEYAKTWNLSVEEKRDVLRLLHTALIEDERADLAADVMTALLRTYTDEDADHAEEDAREYVRTAVVDPKSFSFDHLLRLSAVKRLEKADPLIHEILKLFSVGRLEDYRKFVEKNPTFVKEKLKVDEEALEKKIKMLTLISLAESNQNLALDELSKALDIPDEWLLEEFIIDAIRVNAISGKINELKKELVVTTFQRRTFDRPQWELLQKRLVVLLNNLKHAQKSIASINSETSKE